MALKFPQNQDVIEQSTLGRARGNAFGRVWHGFFEAVYRKFSAVEGATQITASDVASAGASYDQAYAQSQSDMINELKAKVNALQGALKG